MGGDLVEQGDWRQARHVGHETRMGEHKADEQRLLLASGGLRGRRGFRTVKNPQIRQMRADQRAAGCGVPAATFRQDRPISVLSRERRLVRGERFDFAFEVDVGPGKGRALVAL